MKKPFQVGERVRAYEHLSVRSGVIDAIDTKGNVRLLCGSLWYHPKQCRRLKPKPRPQKEREARRVFLSAASVDEIDPTGMKMLFVRKNSGADQSTEFREVLPGETVITREKLEKAFDSVFSPISIEGSGFLSLCKALGLPEGE